MNADMAAVDANLTSQQIRQQLASQSLTIANQATALLLRLFAG